ncbi:hypothetical protein EYF80_034308 [Liparis tanakae]|uniref:Uncharacterized protein n=1 Tax=Liparis tanakae TaxID=230148 RepID=A0A4Z2GPW5_9TELE|nr:hypothetical protein EYF80_034308 [Liparis tanakae]
MIPSSHIGNQLVGSQFRPTPARTNLPRDASARRQKKHVDPNEPFADFLALSREREHRAASTSASASTRAERFPVTRERSLVMAADPRRDDGSRFGNREAPMPPRVIIVGVSLTPTCKHKNMK